MQQENNGENTQSGVGYCRTYRIKKNTKNENNSCITSFGLEADASKDVQGSLDPRPKGLLDTHSQTGSPTPDYTDEDIINFDIKAIKRYLVQLFDNGDQALQRYKVRIRFNLVDDLNAEFIASVSKDYRNFVKYLPEQDREQIKAEIKDIMRGVKLKYGIQPYIGKFHENMGRKTKSTRSQVEPLTYVAVWWDQENRGWECIIRIKDFVEQVSLFDHHITAKQKQAGLRAQDLWINKQYDVRYKGVRTWSERMTMELAKRNG